MNKLIIDVGSEKIFLMIITSNNIYNITKDNTKINYEKLTIIINDFLKLHKIILDNIDKIYINRRPGSYAGIRNLVSIAKAFNLAKKIDYYLFSFEDFNGEKNLSYQNIPYLCEKFKIEKNLINSFY